MGSIHFFDLEIMVPFDRILRILSNVEIYILKLKDKMY